MPKSKAAPNRTVQFEVGVKGRKPMTVEADSWNAANIYATTSALVFTLHGELVLSLAPGKWDYVRRVTAVDRPDVAKED